MFRRLIEAFRGTRSTTRPTLYRPAIEALESRLAPSVTPVFEVPAGEAVQTPLPPAIHATIVSPTPALVPVVAVEVAPVAAVQAGNRAEFFASAFVEQEAAQPAALELSLEDAAAAVPAAAPAPLPAHTGQPLLAWVLGMTCMLMLSWERHLRKPSLAGSASRGARWVNTLSNLSAYFARVWRPRARSACV